MNDYRPAHFRRVTDGLIAPLSDREQQTLARAQAVMAAASQVFLALSRSGGKWSTNARHAELALALACRTHFEQDDLQAVIDTAEHDLGIGDYAAPVTPSQSTEPPCPALFGGAR